MLRSFIFNLRLVRAVDGLRYPSGKMGLQFRKVSVKNGLEVDKNGWF